MEERSKLVLAVVQEDDYDRTVEALGKEKIFVTKLSSTGGFLKKKNITLMIGVEESRLPEVYAILKQYAGKRTEVQYTTTVSVEDTQYANFASTATPVPVDIEVGGTTIFTLDMDSLQKF